MTPPVLWSPDPERAAVSQMAAFARACEQATGRSLPDYAALHAFSIEDVGGFWSELLRFVDPPREGAESPACAGEHVETARFFPGLRLSWAEALLSPRFDDGLPAIIGVDERGHVSRLSRGELRARVERARSALASLGVGPGDRVAALARSTPETVVCALAVASLGATWSSVSPDLALSAVLSRLTQTGPRVLLHHATLHYQGATRSLADLVRGVAAGLPSLKLVVALEEPVTGLDVPEHTLAALVDQAAPLTDPWPRFPFDHPLLVLFSSGTTGAPKCIVHGHGGTLLEHAKEHRLHADLGPGDVVFFQTTTGWMMWNWLVSVLGSGAAILLYDGSATYPAPDALLRVAAEHGVTVFGTSPAWIQLQIDARTDARAHDLGRLRAVQSTGSVLAGAHYDWVAEQLGPLPLHSVSGGTDLVGCFVLGAPSLPVHRGESPCKGLGFDLLAFSDGGASPVGTGELVCRTPFPSRPVALLNDPGGERLHAAYYAQNEGFWTHGDLVELTERGTARVLGRSDGVLNIRGIRIGPAEIYAALDGVSEVRAAMAVDQDDRRGDRRLVLLVVLEPGRALDRPLTLRIKKEIKQRTSSAHVPAVVVQVDDLPTTHNGKRSERAAQDALNGRPVRNLSALRNPTILNAIVEHPDLRR